MGRPRAAAAAATQQAATAPATGEPTLQARALRLLLVEDDATVAAAISGLLEARGHQVLHVAHGLAALAEIGTPGKYRFARPMTDRPGLDFSFSGLKTQVLMAWKASDQSDATRADIARGFEDAVVDTLAIKCERALDAAGCDTLVLAGGVGANKRLREKLQALAAKRGGRVCFPRPALCTDNGAMIAFAGAVRLEAGEREDLGVHVRPRWEMGMLEPVRSASPA